MRTQPLALVKTGKYPPRTDPAKFPILDILQLTDEQLISFTQPEGDALVIDLETQGTEVWNHNNKVIGVALADDSGACYLHIGPEETGQARWRMFCRLLLEKQTPLLAHNTQFDAAWLTRDASQEADGDEMPPHHNWFGCTLTMAKHFASEGFVGQQHGLKHLQTAWLGWEESNEKDLDAWLCDAGYGRWVNKKDVGRVAAPDKSQMWRAPRDILGRYAALDAEATWLLWTCILKPLWLQFDAYQVYHQEWMHGPHGLQRHLVTQKLRGVKVDTDKLQSLREALEKRILTLTEEFLTHPEVAPHIKALEEAVIQAVRAEEPPRWRKLPELGREPPALTKAGSPSSAYTRWAEKKAHLDRLQAEIKNVEAGGRHTIRTLGQETTRWTNWSRKYEEVRTSRHFNLRSPEHLRQLFYDRLGYPVVVMTDNEDNPQPGTDEEARKGWGPAGQLLLTYATVEKLRSSVVSLQGKLDSAGLYHPELRVPGTATGRLSGSGGYNWQNCPKSKEILECFLPRPGHKILACDIASLEQVVLANLSGDPSLMKLYGPGAKANDVYLFNGANLPGKLGAAIRATGYDPDNPTKEGISAAKKDAKKERSIAKVITLSCIAEGTLVRVRNQGWKPIQEILPGEEVWDGNSWTTQDGSVYRGTKPVICFNRTYMTPDHKVLTHVGWQISEEANPAQLIRPSLPSATWADVWHMAVHCAATLARRCRLSLGRGTVSGVHAATE